MPTISFDNSYLKLPERFYEAVEPAKVPDPQVFAFNTPLADYLGIPTNDPQFITDVFAGRFTPQGAASVALAYAGHQFGHFVPQLGDGRAVLLGEVIGQDGKRFDLQLKGSGQTPFSRRGDGKSPLGPVIREYLVSEGMHALGVPTTRALCAATTGEPVYREAIEPGGIFTRVASSHIRVGTFEFFAARRDQEGLKALLEYTVSRHDPDLDRNDELHAGFLKRVAERKAKLVAHWMSLGFIHGVMNTDNTSIAGETIDYGPCAFMDEFRHDQVFSYIDRHGRYAYQQQAKIAQWNLARLADCLSIMLGAEGYQHVDALEEIIEQFPSLFHQTWLERMRPKLGMIDPQDNDEQLIGEWLNLLEQHHLDFTGSFRQLAKLVEHSDLAGFPAEMNDFIATWRQRVLGQSIDAAEICTTMNESNPIYIPRNHLVQRAITSGEQGDFEFFHRLLAILQQPYLQQADAQEFELPAKEAERVFQTFCGT